MAARVVAKRAASARAGVHVVSVESAPAPAAAVVVVAVVVVGYESLRRRKAPRGERAVMAMAVAVIRTTTGRFDAAHRPPLDTRSVHPMPTRVEAVVVGVGVVVVAVVVVVEVVVQAHDPSHLVPSGELYRRPTWVQPFQASPRLCLWTWHVAGKDNSRWPCACDGM